MLSDAFELVTEQELGKLSGEDLKTWKRLVARRKRLDASEQRLDADAKRFLYRTVAEFDIRRHHGSEGIQLKDDGRLVQLYCECYRCQARLQNLLPSHVVESMIRQNLIHPNDVLQAREWAARRDKQLGQHLAN